MSGVLSELSSLKSAHAEHPPTSSQPFCSRLSRPPQGTGAGSPGAPRMLRSRPPWPLSPSRVLPASSPPLHFRALPGVSAGPGPPSTAPSDRSKKSSSSLASTLGLKKLFLALGHSTRPQLGKARSYSVEQLQSPTPGPASHTSTPRAKKAPSLQSLHLVSPEGPQPRGEWHRWWRSCHWNGR